MYPSRSPERMREYRKRYREKNREKLRKASKEWREKNSERIDELSKNWYNCPIKKRACNAKYRATKRYATPSWLTENHKTEIEYVYRVAKDANILTGEPYQVDHIVPLQNEYVCGLHVPWNLQVLSAEDNRRKKNKH